MPVLRVVTVVVAGLLTGLLLLSGCGRGEALPGGDDPDTSDGCPDLTVIGLRGQSQSLDHHRGLGTEVDGIVKRLSSDLARRGVADIRVEAVRHASQNTADSRVYDRDVAQGRRMLAARLRTVHSSCPSSRVAVVGFSQGAQIAHETLAGSGPLAADVDLLVMLGSPRRDPDAAGVTAVDLPGPEPTETGSLGAGPSLGPLARRTIQACTTGDVVCSASRTSDDYTIHKHAYERPAVASAIALAAATRLADDED